MQRQHKRTSLVLSRTIVLSSIMVLWINWQAQAAFGGKIAFVSRQADIYVIDPNGSNLRNLTNTVARDMYPSWSPDGRRIAFASDRINPLQLLEIFVMDADGQNVQRLTNRRGGSDWGPVWSPDGQQIAFTSLHEGSGNIYVMDADGRNLRQLIWGGWEASWSPDGRRIAFTSNRDGSQDIYVMEIDGGNIQRLTDHPEFDFEPAWSPNGRQIAFVSNRADGKSPKQRSEIYVMDADGRNVRRLTYTQSLNKNPSWSPDGKQIIFASNRDGKYDIYIMDANGENIRKIPVNLGRDDVSKIQPVWVDPSVSLSVSPAEKQPTTWGRIKSVAR